MYSFAFDFEREAAIDDVDIDGAAAAAGAGSGNSRQQQQESSKRKREEEEDEKKKTRRLALRDQANKFVFPSSLSFLSKNTCLLFPPLSTPAIAITRIKSITWGKNRGAKVQESAFRRRRLFFFLQPFCFDLDRSIGWWPINDDADADKNKGERTVFPSSARSTRHLSPLAARDRCL